MDWIGDKLSMLIEQGKKALNAQVVVMSDVKEDEVDDGSGMWEEDEEEVKERERLHSRSRSGSVRYAKRPKALNLGSASASTSTSFPSSTSAPVLSNHHHNPLIMHLPPASQSTTSLQNVSVEDPMSFESPELRESMQRARARMMARRGGT